MKTTKYQIYKEIKTALNNSNDVLSNKLVEEVVFSVSDVEQLQKEILESYSYVRCYECGRDSIHVERVIKAFNNFKGK